MLLRPRTGLQDITVEVDAGSEGSPTVAGGRDDPGLPDAAERAAGRDPCLARRRHPGLPAAAAAGRRRGLRRQRQEAVRRAAAARAVRARRGEDQRAALPAATEHPQLDPQLPRAVGRAGAQRHPARRVRRLLERRPAGVRQPGGGDPRDPAGVPLHAARDAARPRQRRPAVARGGARAPQAHARGADARTRARGVAAVLQPDHAPDQAADPPVHARGCRSRSGTSSRPPRR